MTDAQLQLHTPLARALRELLAGLAQRLALSRHLTVYLAGGMAVHLYTGKRVTGDVDAEFAARVLLPNDLVVEIVDEAGDSQLLYFDSNYNPMFSLLHEDYQQDAHRVGLDIAHIDLRLLSPVDLAVSKLARFAEIDREDITDLARHGLLSSAELEARAGAALTGYVGNTAMVRHNLRDAVELVQAVERQRKSSAGQP